MTMRIANMLGSGDKPDAVKKAQIEHFNKVDPKDGYVTDKVKVVLSVGGKDVPNEVVVRSQTSGLYMFVTAHENQALVDTSSDDTWRSLACNALNKFAAMQNRNIIFGPRPEDTNPYNFMVELQRLPPGQETTDAE